MSRRISWNCQGVRDRNYFLTHIATYHPTTLTIIQDTQLALDAYAASQHQTKVGLRQFSPLEGKQWWTVGWRDWCDNTITHVGHPELWHYIGANEPEFDGTHTRKEYADNWLSPAVEYLAERGYQGSVGQWGLGTYEQADIENGSFDKLMATCGKYPGRFPLGFHEYTLGCLNYGFGQTPPADLLNPDKMQPSSWLKTLPVARTPITEQIKDAQVIHHDLPSYWHLGRSLWTLIRAREKSIAEPQYWMTEFGWDAVGGIKYQVNGQQHDLKDDLIAKFGYGDGTHNIRGVMGLAKYSAAMWQQQGWDMATAAYQQLRHADSLYPSNYIGFNVFVWTNDSFKDPDWVKEGSDISQMGKLHDLLIANATPPPAPPIVIPPPPIVVIPPVTPPPAPVPTITVPLAQYASLVNQIQAASVQLLTLSGALDKIQTALGKWETV